MAGKRLLGALVPIVAIGAGVVTTQRPGHADPVDDRERCATRLSIAMLGKSASAALLAQAKPQDAVDAMLDDPVFIDRFARFINSEFNPEPGANAQEDASYWLMKYVLENDKPYKDMFVGQYNVGQGGAVTVDANGLGYFRSPAWMRRYAGNEQDGYRIVAAFRILNNTTGLSLTAVTNTDGADVSATGRKASGCAGCHYSNWYALDLVAKILSKRQGTGANITFTPPTEGPQVILGGKTIANDKELVTELVASENFRFNACRLAFKFLYGRPENTCEAKVFDGCAAEFASKQTITAAVASVAKDPTFCQ